MDALPALSLEALPERRVEPCGSPRASSQPSTRAKVPHSAVRDPRPRRVLVGEAAQDAHLDGGVADALGRRVPSPDREQRQEWHGGALTAPSDVDANDPPALMLLGLAARHPDQDGPEFREMLVLPRGTVVWCEP